MAADYLTTALVQAHLRDDFASLYTLPADVATLERDILTAELEVKAGLVRYKLPLTAADAISYVTSIALSIFAEIAWRHGAGEDVPEKIKDAAKTARNQLRDLREGKANLAGADAAESAVGVATIVKAGNTPQFDRPNMEGF